MELSKEQISKLPVFFIIGRPRSGTTLLRTLLDAHPNVQIPTECFFIGQLFRKYSKVTFWDEKVINNFYSNLLQTRFYKINAFDSRSIYNDLLKHQGKNSYQNICKIVILNYNSVFPKENILMLGDKNPFYSNFFEKIFLVFQEAKFIHLVRDYRDNYLSIINARFENPSIAYNVKRWKKSVQIVEKFKNKFPEKFFTIRYEDLVNESDKHLSEICNFLDIPYHQEISQFYKYKKNFTERYPEDILNRIHISLFQPITPSKVGLWEKKLNRNKIMIADWIAGDYAKKYEYKRVFSKASLMCKISAAPGLIMNIYISIIYSFAPVLPFWWQKRFFNNFHRINGSFFYKFYCKQKNG